MHLLIPGVAASGDSPRALPPLPNLQALLARMTPEQTIETDDGSPAEPFELALARARGLPDAPGRTPWAAYETQTFGAPCAWFSPVHLETGMNDVRLTDPADVPIPEDQSRALLDACAPLLAEDGIALRTVRPDAWLAQGAMLEGLTCWSPRRAAGRSLLPGQLLRADDPARQGKLLRLVSELQMLIYAHPVNDARERAGLAAINALWLHGAGRLAQPVTPAPGVLVARDLVSAPGNGVQVWQGLDAGPLADLLARVQQDSKKGATARLTLCGPRRARTWVAAPGASWRAVARRLLRPVPVAAALEGL
ncbi:MAG: phosphoglycerate mutase [Burkholderiaceae bacterium]|jgi:hypothetical protein|nr:phosphoglycerate mutase [Burkholderiaceae bacterium]